MTPARCDHRQCTDEMHSSVVDRVKKLESHFDLTAKESLMNELLTTARTNRLLIWCNSVMLLVLVAVQVPQVAGTVGVILRKIVHP